MNEKLAEIESLCPDFQYVDDNRIITSIGMTATFYFWGGHTSEKRQALVDFFEAYEEAFGIHLKWGCDPDSWATRKFSNARFPTLRDHVAGLDEDDCVEWHLSSSAHREEVAQYSITCLTERGWQRGFISDLQFQLPRDHAFDPHHRKTLDELLLRAIETLKPFHGRAGLAAILPEQDVSYEPEAFDLATRYRSLYIPGAGDLIRAPVGPKSIDWITIVGDVLAERMGGVDACADYCREIGVIPVRHRQALVLRTGATPEIGPVTQTVPAGYVKVDRALRPLRDGAHGSMGGGSSGGEVRFNRCTSDQWIRRLDQLGAWPPATPLRLGKVLDGTQPIKKVRLKTGRPSPCYGRFHRPGTEKFGVILMPGDIAPYWLNLGPHGEFLGREAITWELLAEL
ncbi:DUF3396 domain-containing protein [Herbaspirillum sp. WGmk3]|uniref:type VI immunity family protein n=1 Tax=Herbaspirillum sp. WGmk3 TaxID=2919925 RepID=UPI002090DDD3|nr:type VI immunity family protein [Herbaspirillum sp. WGmk3]MCO4857332.1 DUF3396 domain-containing protein [Herbaspirillum sp. WGmk3]